MRLSTVNIRGDEKLCVCVKEGPILMEKINSDLRLEWPEHMEKLIKEEQLAPLNRWYNKEGKKRLETLKDAILTDGVYQVAPLYRTPSKIWGIGLNYVAHAEDLSEKAPTELPASFMKPTTTIVGHGDVIHIPKFSQKTTAEAELGVVIGKRCKNIAEEDWLEYVAGFTTILDMTAEDILRRNPRYLTVSKSFDTFFAFGPQLITPDEIEDVSRLTVATICNGRVHAENTVDHMTFPPHKLVSFHSRVMTLLPGDVISTGTPGAIAIKDGDEISCAISGFEPLINSVVDQKK